MGVEKNKEVHLRPRFKFTVEQAPEAVIKKFRLQQEIKTQKHQIKIVGHHIIIDVAKEEDHYWSPQLHIEIEGFDDNNRALVKGLFGPKPQVWTFFMFLHFAVAFAFVVFGIMAYVKWILKTNYTFSLVMTCLMPLVWVLLYFVGRFGKKTGQKQMNELFAFCKQLIEK